MLHEIYNYHEKAAGKTVADKIKTNIFSVTRQLKEQNHLGHTDPILEGIGEGHRNLVSGNYKIVYKDVKEGVLITDVFDVRQNPVKINNPVR